MTWLYYNTGNWYLGSQDILSQ